MIGRNVSMLIAALVAAVTPQAALAQVFVADGTTVTASGNGITFLFALNRGVINSFAPLGIIGADTNPVLARTGGIISIFQGSTINAVQDALLADDAGSSITVTGTSIISSAGGALASTGATINILGGSRVIAPLGVLASSGATLNISGSTISSETAMVGFAPGTNTINLTNSTVTAVPGGIPDPFAQGAALQVALGGTTTLNADASHITGTMMTDSASISTVNLFNRTFWNMTGSSNVTNLTNSGSTIDFAQPVGGVFKTLTTVNYVGAGGTIGLNTFLGADGSPSDLLIINGGTATGSSFLHITATADSPGAYTIANGIRVVRADSGGTTAESTFTLAGEARAGFIDYRLYRGGVDGSNSNDWFLRSSFNGGNGSGNGNESGDGNGNGSGNGNGNGNGNGDPGNGPVTPPGVLPPGPAPDHGIPPPPGIWPIIGPELATYGVVQPIARQMGLAALGTLHERVGGAAADAACFATAVAEEQPALRESCRPAFWGRLFGQQIDNRYRAFADPRASGQVAGVQVGMDIWRGSLIPGHSDAAGVYFAYGNGNASVDGLVTNAAATAYILQRTGSLTLNTYSFGGYWTHHGPTGWYIDAVLQGSIYNGDASTQFASLSTSGRGFISSLEVGYPIPLPWFGPHFVLEPEGQIIWQRASFDAANDGLGQVALGTTSGASGRLGLRGRWSINDSAGRVWQPYVLANIWRDWGAEANTMFGPDSVLLSEQVTRLEFAGGISAKLLPGLRLYAQAGYQFAVSDSYGGRRDGIKGDFGLHYTW